jgi:signal transduction histidine kinase
MRIFSSLTNRIFVASALLAVTSIGIAIVNVQVAVTRQAERELLRGLDEAGTLVEEYRRLLFDHFSREARLIADLPKLKAAVSVNDPETVRPLAEEYQQQLGADLFVVTGSGSQALARAGTRGGAVLDPDALPGIPIAAQGGEATMFVPYTGGILQVVSVPIWIDPLQPEILGTLSVGVSLDDRAAARFRALTNAEVAFGIDGQIHAATLPEALWTSLEPLLTREGLAPSVRLGAEEYVALASPLRVSSMPPAVAPVVEPRDAPRAVAIVLRSRTERLQFLSSVHRTLGITALVAVLAATLISYGIARTVTRPLGAITATMRDMASTGDLTRPIPRAGSRWDDEDAKLLAGTFNTMTGSIARFQREVAERERLSSLGRLSTVVAHEIRNPLMIIKTVLHSLRGRDVGPPELRAAVADIDEEIARLNRTVTEVLDFARPIRFEYGPADLNALCREAVQASAAGVSPAAAVSLDLDPALPEVTTDGERVRLALVNILVNARHAVRTDKAEEAASPAIAVATTAVDGTRVAVTIRDSGPGIASDDLPHVFDPYFTTRRTGTGLGLAISRNIIEGLGGNIAVASRAGEGTEVRIELPVVRGGTSNANAQLPTPNAQPPVPNAQLPIPKER